MQRFPTRRITDLLLRQEDRPISITGSNYPPIDMPVDLSAEVVRIFGDPGPIQLDFDRGKGK